MEPATRQPPRALPSAAHNGAVSDEARPAGERSTFAVPLEELEYSARVPLDEQTTEQAVARPVDEAQAWLEARRQARLAGGA